MRALYLGEGGTMRFAITCVDRSLNVFETFLQAGWEPVKLFTVPVDGVHNQNISVIAKAVQLNIPVQLSRMREEDLRQLAELGCDVLVVAGYDWKIGDWKPYLRYAVNFHPSLLPEGRGPYPAIRAILNEEKIWAVTCHKVSPIFDEGDILSQDIFPLCADESHESINIKIEMASQRLAAHVARNFVDLWNGARPQSGGSYWAQLTDEERTIDFSRSVAEILRLVRAYGLYECKAKINGTTIFVRRAVGWTEAHAYQPGTRVYVQQRTMVVAVRDGFIGLVEWSSIEPGAQRHIGR
jgi:methionyl-tRNA formyltransferase